MQLQRGSQASRHTTCVIYRMKTLKAMQVYQSFDCNRFQAAQETTLHPNASPYTQSKYDDVVRTAEQDERPAGAKGVSAIAAVVV